MVWRFVAQPRRVLRAHLLGTTHVRALWIKRDPGGLLVAPFTVRMRRSFLLSFLLASLSLVGCSVTTTDTTDDPPTSFPNDTNKNTPTTPPSSPAKPPSNTIAQPKQPIADEGSFYEVVYVFMVDHDGGGWMCTGTLVAKDKVITAAHCLDTKEFVSYKVVAPNAPQGRVERTASNPQSFGGDYNDVAQPDIGFLTLNQPIDLPHYAELADVTTRVEAKESILAAAYLRTAEQAEAPLAMSPQEPVSSTVDLGYEHGFGTPLFTKGGDSGGGLFLVENGKTTHKLIATVRQPEPDRNIDHFTRVDAAFLTWYNAKAGVAAGTK